MEVNRGGSDGSMERKKAMDHGDSWWKDRAKGGSNGVGEGSMG